MKVPFSISKETICALKFPILDDLLHFATDRVHSTVGSLVSDCAGQPDTVEVEYVTVRLLRMGVMLDLDEGESTGDRSVNFYDVVHRVLTNLARPYVDIGLSFYFLLARRTEMGYRIWSPNVVTGGLSSLMIINPPGFGKLVDIVYLRLGSRNREGKWYITELIGPVYVERLLETTDLANHIEPLVFRQRFRSPEEFSTPALSTVLSVERLLETTDMPLMSPPLSDPVLSVERMLLLSPPLSDLVLTAVSPALSPVLPPLPDGATWKECVQYISRNGLAITTRGPGRNREAILADIRRLLLPSSSPGSPGGVDRRRSHDEIGRSGLTPSSKKSSGEGEVGG